MGSEATAFLLRQADTLVKEKKYEAAMKLVRAVRAQDPQNPYAIAYEERIRAIILNVSDRKAHPTRPAHTVAAGRVPLTQNEEGPQAVAEDSEADRHSRIRNYVRLSRTFFAAGREEEALNELAFASMIDPKSEEVKSFEAEIRRARAERDPDRHSTEPSETRTPEERNTTVLDGTVEDETREEALHSPEPEHAVEDLISVLPTVEDSVEESIDGSETQIQVPVEQVDNEIAQVSATPEPAEEPGTQIQVLVEQVDNDNAQVLATPEPAEDLEMQIQVPMEQVNNETAQVSAIPEPAEDVVSQIQVPVEQVNNETAEVLEPQAQVPMEQFDSRTASAIAEPDHTENKTTELTVETTEALKSDQDPDEKEQLKIKLVKRQLVRGTKLYMSGAFDEALAEIALGLVDEPDNAELRGLERKIWQAKDASSGEQVDNRYQRDHLVRLHLLAAEEFRKKNEFTRALDEVAKAYALDPENKDIKQMDARIREGESRQDRNDGKILKLVYPNARTAGGSA